MPVGQNIVHCGEIRKTVIINYHTLSNDVWLEPEECLEEFTSSVMFTKFKSELRKKLNIFWDLQKYAI